MTSSAPTPGSTRAPGESASRAIVLGVIALYAALGLDPLVRLFYYGGTFGGLGVLFLVTATSVAVLVFLARNRSGENAWRRVVAPALASVLLLVIVALAVANLVTLLGVETSSPLWWALPGAYVVAAAVGVVWALVLRSANPGVYERIGLGAKASTSRAVRALPPASAGPRTPPAIAPRREDRP